VGETGKCNITRHPERRLYEHRQPEIFSGSVL